MLANLISALLVGVVASQATNCYNEATSANLTVKTRTGTFVGNLNDTYPDVRQFKNIPYAKVWLQCPSVPTY